MRKELIFCDVCEKDCTGRRPEAISAANGEDYVFGFFTPGDSKGIIKSRVVIYVNNLNQFRESHVCPDCLDKLKQGAIDTMLAEVRPEQVQP